MILKIIIIISNTLTLVQNLMRCNVMLSHVKFLYIDILILHSCYIRYGRNSPKRAKTNEYSCSQKKNTLVALGTYSEGEMDSAEMKATASSEGMKAVQSAIRLFVMMICIGYTMVWIMMPTNTFYLKWLPAIHSKTDSTYFGTQGLYS